MKSEMLDIFNNCILVYRKTIQYIISLHSKAKKGKCRNIGMDREYFP